MNKRIIPAVVLILTGSMAFAAKSVEEVMKKYDKNHDGVLDATEVAQMLLESEDKKFDAQDKNKDGQVSRSEMHEAISKDAKEKTYEFGSGTAENPNMNPDSLKAYLLGSDPEFAKAQATDWFSTNLPNLKVRQSFLTPQGQELPAKMSYTYDNHAGASYYTFDGAISYYFDLRDMPLSIAPSFEAHSTDKKGAARDSIAARVLFESATENYFLSFAPTYETDSKARSSTIGAELNFSPSPSSIPGLGSTVELAKDVSLRWRPFFTAQYGHVIDDGGLPLLQASNDYVRLGGKFEVSLFIGTQFLLTGAYANLTEVTGLKNSYNYFEVNGVYYIDRLKRFSVGTTYKKGEQSPKFQREDTLNLWFGVKL